VLTRFFHRVTFVALSLFIALSISVTLPVFAASADVLGEKVTLVFDRALPNVPGKSMKVQVVEYAPGVSSIPHTHAASAFRMRKSGLTPTSVATSTTHYASLSAVAPGSELVGISP
jgi:hypothetical protein